MPIASIDCTLPFCGTPKEEKGCSNAFRITAVAVGIILLMGGVALLSGKWGYFDPRISYACVCVGLVALAIGSFVRCVKDKGESDLSSLPYVPPKDDFLPYAPPKTEDGPLPSLEQLRSEPVAVIPQSVQPIPSLAELQTKLVACVGYLNELHKLLTQKGVTVVYDGNKLLNFISTNVMTLGHPAEGPPNVQLLLKWKELVDAIKAQETPIVVAFIQPGGLVVNYASHESQLILQTSKDLNALHYLLAEGFYALNMRAEAFEEIKENNDQKVKEPFLFKMALDYYKAGDRKNTVKMLKEIHHFRDEKEDFFYRLAKEDYLAGNRPGAIEMIKETYYDTKRKEDFFYRLALDYYKEGDRKEALKMIKETYRDTARKENFIFKMAEDYCQEGDKPKAAELLREISYDTQRKEAFKQKHGIA